ncbi:MAG: choice-of-anchor Q domain-containing protein [bacterium]
MFKKIGKILFARYLLIFLFIFSFFFISNSTDAAITIQRTGSKTYRNIQSALNAAAPGDIIFLGRGTYAGSGNGNNINWPDINNLTLRGISANETVISAEALGRAIKVGNAVSLTIEALTIKDGKVSSNGAGIYLADNSKLCLKNVVLRNCSAIGHSILAGTGGAIRSSGSSIHAVNCTFTKNYAGFSGGVAYGGTWEARSCAFIGNWAASSSGVAYNGRWKASGCVFHSNSSLNAAGVSEADEWEAVNCIFTSNSAPYGGVAWGGTWNVYNCNFYDNFSPQGGIAYVANWSAVNSIFWGSNNPFEGGRGELKYCDVQGGFRILGLKECISANPMFRDAPRGDFHLTVDSPCIDTGTSEGAPENDIEGRSRPYPSNSKGLLYDMGAYEFQRPAYDIFVSPYGSDRNTGRNNSPLRTIQRALSLVSEGRTIFLKKGRYQGPINNWPKYIQDITIKSMSATREDTVVSWSGTGGVFDLSSVPNDIRGTIESITITAGITADAGSVVLLPANSNIKIENCFIEGIRPTEESGNDGL